MNCQKKWQTEAKKSCFFSSNSSNKLYCLVFTGIISFYIETYLGKFPQETYLSAIVPKLAIKDKELSTKVTTRLWIMKKHCRGPTLESRASLSFCGGNLILINSLELPNHVVQTTFVREMTAFSMWLAVNIGHYCADVVVWNAPQSWNFY